MQQVDQSSKENAWEIASRSVVGGVDPEDFARGWDAARAFYARGSDLAAEEANCLRIEPLRRGRHRDA